MDFLIREKTTVTNWVESDVPVDNRERAKKQRRRILLEKKTMKIGSEKMRNANGQQGKNRRWQ